MKRLLSTGAGSWVLNWSMSRTTRCDLYKAHSENNITPNVWDAVFYLFQRKLNFLPIHVMFIQHPLHTITKIKIGYWRKLLSLCFPYLPPPPLPTSNLVFLQIIINSWSFNCLLICFMSSHLFEEVHTGLSYK